MRQNADADQQVDNAGIVLTPYFGISTINQNDFSFPALMVSLLGAVILLAVVSLFRRQRVFR